MSKPSIPQGTRDFSPEVVTKRNFILNTIKRVFELYGFQPLETPAMEKLDTLMGKYGEEGDKLIYKIRSNKNLLNNFSETTISDLKKTLKEETDFDYTFLPKKSDKALRYDLTIPFARYVSMNKNNLIFPFKRYQIQPVWRGDKPQRGRYREFTQCDVDIVGSLSLLNEIDLLNIYQTVFNNLKIPILIKLNNRKILQGIAEYCGCTEKLLDITTAIDKLDKLSQEKVIQELSEKGIPPDKIKVIFDCISINEENEVFFTEEQLKEEHNFSDSQTYEYIKIQNSRYRKDIGILNCLQGWFSQSIGDNIVAPTGLEGIEEVISIFQFLVDLDLSIDVDFDITLARGLNYYTGAIFEVKATNIKMGSIGGGGRYDDLTGLFGVPGIPGVGISFGVDRIYDVLEESKLFPEDLQTSVKALFFNMGYSESISAYKIMLELRKQNIACELYHESSKLDKQFKYAEKKNIPYVVIIGSKEIENKNAVIKNLKTGEQQNVLLDELSSFFSNI
ncbi:MAG: histidine--tRNA ligase [Ferruginibacter sp.]